MTILSKPLIIGLAGSHASGKDTLAQYLVEKYGLYHVSTGDVFREEAMKKYGSVERPVLYKTANEIRQQHGHGAVSNIALQRYQAVKGQHPNGLIVSGFRALAEAKIIQDAGGIIIYVDAPSGIRYERLKSRARVEEGTISEEEFKKREAAENGGTDPAFDISAIRSVADIALINDKDSETLLEAAEKALKAVTN